MAEYLFGIWNRRWTILLAICVATWMLVNPKILGNLLRLCLFIVLLTLLPWVKKHWKIWKKILWVAWKVFYFFSGLFIWHHIFKGLSYICRAHAHVGEQYTTGPGSAHAHQWQHPPPVFRRTIPTWTYCKLYDSNHAPRSSFGGKYFSRRFVAHVDTGNRAQTVISKAAFQFLFPGGKEAKHKGSQWIVGITGAMECLPLVEISYELDGVVGPNNRPLCVSLDALVHDHPSVDYDILISTTDMKIFHDRFGYVIQPVEKSINFGFL